MSKNVVGSCPRCGAPIYEGDLDTRGYPSPIFTCDCRSLVRLELPEHPVRERTAAPPEKASVNGPTATAPARTRPAPLQTPRATAEVPPAQPSTSVSPPDPPPSPAKRPASARVTHAQSPKPYIFVSSTTEFLKERNRIATDLRADFELFLFEEDYGDDLTPEQRLRTEIERSDVFLSILGTDRGSPCPVDNEKSVVEWEFETACGARGSHGRPSIMPFLQDGAVEKTEQENPRQHSFLRRVRAFRGHWCPDFSDEDDLAQKVGRRLLSWGIKRYRPALTPRWFEGALLGVTFLSIVFAVLPWVLRESFAGRTPLLISSVATSSAIVCLLILRMKYGGARARF